VAAAQARGHSLALFNRGRTRPGLFPGIPTLQGDRDPAKGEGLKALESGKWDAVIDNSGYYPRMVSASAKLLAPNVKRYIYISSISVYARTDVEGADERAAVATIPDPTVETMGKDFGNYGALKALCEQAAEAAMPGRATIVRPGYIVGPDDPTGRFTWWPVRVDRGGEMPMPGTPADPIQFIDVRDLGEWLIKLVEDGTTGVFNATGPAAPFNMGGFLEACRTKTPVRPTWFPPAFVKRQNLAYPIWDAHEGETLGAHAWSNARALKAGLRFRPAAATCRDTLAWYQSPASEGRRKLAGPTAEQEAAALAAWK
jgi:2'-hydroxyisoflavone reductase